jgi:hypothetical protein
MYPPPHMTYTYTYPPPHIIFCDHTLSDDLGEHRPLTVTVSA